MSVQTHRMQAEIDELKARLSKLEGVKLDAAKLAELDETIKRNSKDVEGIRGAVKHAVDTTAELQRHVNHLTAQAATRPLISSADTPAEPPAGKAEPSKKPA